MPKENSRLFAALESTRVHEVIYVSTAAAIVTRLTRCYEYPRVKRLAEEEARRRLRARVLILGLVVDRLQELPPGRNAATLHRQLEEFMLAPRWVHDGGSSMRLFELVDVPFARPWEARIHRVYDQLQWLLRSWPCALRPIDFVLRALGIRWYGYINLSNRLWTLTTS
jgi:hypothetical protein